MDWKGLGAKVATVGAGLLGTAFGVPGVGALVGGIVSNALGVENTPDAIARAIDTNPEAATKLLQIQSEERIRLQEITMKMAVAETEAETARMKQVNETMRAELRAPLDIRSAWRPIFGLVSAMGYGLLLFSVVGAVIGAVLMAFGAWGAQPENVTVLAEGVGAMVSKTMPILVVGLTVVGVFVKKRSDEKQGTTGGGMFGALADRIRGNSG